MCRLDRFDGQLATCEKVQQSSYSTYIVGTHCQLFRWKRILIILGFYDHQIFIPVHEGNDLDGHWILLVVYVKRGITELWDSAGGARLTDGRHAMIQQVVISIL